MNRNASRHHDAGFPETRTRKPQTRLFFPSSLNRATVFNANFFGRLKTPILSGSEASIPGRFSQKHSFPGSSSEIPAEIPEKSMNSSKHLHGDPTPIGRTKSCLFRIFLLN